MPKSFLVKKYSNDSHWNSSKWSKLYSTPSASSTPSAADINSASLLLNLSTSGQSSSNLFNGNKHYADTIGSNSIYRNQLASKLNQKNQLNRFAFTSNLLGKQPQKSRFLLPPSRPNHHHHLYVNGNSISKTTNLNNLNNGNLMKSSFAKQLNDRSTDGQDDSNQFKKLLPTSSALAGAQARQPKTNLIRYNTNEQSKRPPRPTKVTKVQITKENSTNDDANQKKTEQSQGNLLF